MDGDYMIWILSYLVISSKSVGSLKIMRLHLNLDIRERESDYYSAILKRLIE